MLKKYILHITEEKTTGIRMSYNFILESSVTIGNAVNEKQAKRRVLIFKIHLSHA